MSTGRHFALVIECGVIQPSDEKWRTLQMALKYNESLRELLDKLSALSKESRELIVRVAERCTNSAHVCDHNGGARRVHAPGSWPIARVARTCSVCGVVHPFPPEQGRA